MGIKDSVFETWRETEFDSLLVIVVKAVRGAFSGRISWHFHFYLM